MSKCEKTHHTYSVVYECRICGRSDNKTVTIPCARKSRRNSYLREVGCGNCKDKSAAALVWFFCNPGETDSWGRTNLQAKSMAIVRNIDET